MNSIRCPQCNFLSFATATECKRCKLVFQVAEAETSQYQPEFSGNGHFGNSGFSPNSAPSNDFHQNDYQNFNQSNGQTGYNYNRQSPPGFRTTNQPQKKKLAIISMVLGIVGFPFIGLAIGTFLMVILGMAFGTPGAVVGFVLPLLAIPIGLIAGIVSLVRTKNRPSEYGGKGFAIAGISMTVFSLLTIPIVAAIAIPNLLAARRSANEGAAISTIRKIGEAENTYQDQQYWKTGIKKCAEMSQLSTDGLIDPATASGKKSGYRFTLTMIGNSCEISAVPMETDGISASGTRTFYASSDENWKIRVKKEKGLPAGRNDPLLENGY